MAAQDCIDEIKKAAGVDLSDEELDELLTSLDTVRQNRQAKAGVATIEEEMLDAADALASDAIEAAQIERRNRLINIQKFNEIMALADEADKKFGDPSLALQAKTVGITRVLEGGRKSADARGNALANQYLGGLLSELKRENLLIDFNNKANGLDIARDLEALTNPEARGSGNARTRRIAEIIDKYRKTSIGRANRAGAWIKPLPGYITRQTHDPILIRKAGLDEWKRAILPLLDVEKTFGGADADEFLNGAFDALKSGVHIKHHEENDLKLAFKGPGNLAKRVSQNRVFHFKNADAFMEYNNQFGKRSLQEAIFQDLDRLARSTALMEEFGPNPEAMFDTATDKLREKYRGDDKKLKKLESERIKNRFYQVDGTTRIPGNVTFALVSAIARSIQTMASLGFSVLSAFTDPVFQSTEFHRHGVPLLRAWKDTFNNILEGFSTDREKREFAELIGVGLDGQIGDMYARFSAVDDIPGGFSKAMQLFFKFNLLAPWTDANKRGFGLMFAREMAMKKNQSWDQINEEMRLMMSRYGLDERKWDIARKSIREAEDGREYLMPDGIHELPDDLFPGMSARAIRKEKDDISTALQSMYVDRADFAAPTSGARESSIALQGTRPGTAIGEAMRFQMQFKATPITIATKGVGESLFVKGATDIRSALFRGEANYSQLANIIIGTTVLGYLSQTAKEVTKGREPRDPSDPLVWKAAFLQGGGLGIYGDFLLGETNRFGSSLLDTLAGPTFGAISDVDKLRAKLLAGDPLAADTLRFVYNNTPWLNLFYTRVAMDYLLLYNIQESINPGYLRRMERRLKRENNQEYIIPPTSVIPRGGSF